MEYGYAVWYPDCVCGSKSRYQQTQAESADDQEVSKSFITAPETHKDTRIQGVLFVTCIDILGSRTCSETVD